MAASFFFYDLETTGFDPRRARVVQFAGQRTDMNLQPIGEPINVLIKLTPDVLPEPDAVLITRITPQQTLADGMTEAEFLKLFYKEAVKPGTIFVGFNNVRFDDEFMRFLHYRNFYDAYEWQWYDNCSRWDILDLIRMTRALRPEGIEWPFAPDGKPTNRLEFLTAVNKLDHENAHDALNDVYATIAVAKLIKDKQPDLFDYLLKVRDKKKVAELVTTRQPFVYTSGHIPSQYLHTTVSVLVAPHPQQGSGLVYDLRFDPTPFLKKSVDELVECWRYNREPDVEKLPVKTMKYNRCPAVAPMGVIKDKKAQERLGLTLETVNKHLEILKKGHKNFAQKILQAVAQLDAEREREQTALVDNQLTVDGRLYDGFLDDADRQTIRAVRVAEPSELESFSDRLHDDRLVNLLPLYKARNFPKSLDSEEQQAWEKFCYQQLFEGGPSSRAARYFARLEELTQGSLTSEQQYILEELQLYGQSIMPADATG